MGIKRIYLPSKANVTDPASMLAFTEIERQTWPDLPLDFQDITRTKLTAARTYYVRTDGSNSNTGLVNSPGGAFLTVQYAWNVITQTLDFGGFTVTIQIADGTYSATQAINAVGAWTGGGTVVIQGNAGTPANVIFNGTGRLFQFNSLLPGTLTIKNMQIGGIVGIELAGAGVVQYSNIVFTSTIVDVNSLVEGGSIQATGNYSISGNKFAHLEGITGALDMSNRTITLIGTPNFTGAFIWGTRLANITAQTDTFVGSATGSRFHIDTNTILYTNGTNEATYLPGNALGTKTTGGVYQ